MAELERILAGGTVEPPPPVSWRPPFLKARHRPAVPRQAPGALPNAGRKIVDPIALASLVIP